MKLQTFIEIPASSWQIGYDDRILLLGSCFSDEIGSKLQEHYFRLTSNPFGTLYNPLSIAQALQMKEVPELVEYGGLWHSMAHHGSFSFASRTETSEAVSRSIRTLQQAFQDASVVMITFGTAWIYEQDGRVVGNCHKMPADCFTRRRLSVEEIVAAWQPILAAYPDKKWLFTVSPIRHVKDGLHENQLSKATLLMAVEQLTHQSSPITNSGKAAYFPSYEILLDELRDYRFYADDLVHPSTLAVQYIWERFVGTYMSPSTREEMHTLHQLWLDRHHTFLHADTKEAYAFLQRTQSKLKQLLLHYPWIE